MARVTVAKKAAIMSMPKEYRRIFTMKRSVYYRGVPGKKYGIWNGMAKCFQFNICEDTPMLAEARLYQKIGDDEKKKKSGLIQNIHMDTVILG